MTARKEWTVDQALAAQRKFEQAGGSWSDPVGPVFQWASLQALDELEARYRAGDRMALMRAIRTCANHDLVLPLWAANAYISAFDTVNLYRAKSWDKVFGRPLPKGRSLNAARKRLTKSLPVLIAIGEAHRIGRAIDEKLFKDIGDKFAISASTTRDYYHAAKRRFPWMDPTKDELEKQKLFPKNVDTRHT